MAPDDAYTDVELTGLAADLLSPLGLGDQPSPQVLVRWNPRLRSTAGRAFIRDLRVELNPRLRDFPGEVDRTLRHELAHIVAGLRAGPRRIAAHGPEWRMACAELGIPGESVTHRLPLPRSRQVRRFAYRCPACGTVVRRARAIKRPSACLACCRAHAGGRFDSRFLLVPVDPTAEEGTH